MSKIGLTAVLNALRAELETASREGEGKDIRFPIASIDVEFQVAVTKDVKGGGGVKFWVLNFDASGEYTNATTQTVTLHLGAPLTLTGSPMLYALKVPDELEKGLIESGKGKSKSRS